MDVEFLPDAEAVGHRFTELLAKADSVDIVVAWAGNPRTGVQRLLWKARHKVRRLVVGCTLFNTHPEFLERWQDQPHFRVVRHTTELFHPKLYLFRRRGDVYLLAGSSNLTDGGFEKNREANVLLKAVGKNRSLVAAGVAYMKACYDEASIPRGTEWRSWLAGYRSRWTKMRRLRARPLDPDDPGNARHPRRHGLSGLGAWSFPEYFTRLRKGNNAYDLRLADWLDPLEKIRDRWAEAGWRLRAMPIEDRRLVAGQRDREAEGAAAFGVMGQGHFLHAVIYEPARIDAALHAIPRQGGVQHSDWAAFCKAYSRAFPHAAVGSASRLLSLWRPDVFFSANAASVPQIARVVDVSQAKLRDWAGYWESTRWIAQCPWARSGAPTTRTAERCWRGRVALLDVLMYKPAR